MAVSGADGADEAEPAKRAGPARGPAAQPAPALGDGAANLKRSHPSRAVVPTFHGDGGANRGKSQRTMTRQREKWALGVFGQARTACGHGDLAAGTASSP